AAGLAHQQHAGSGVPGIEIKFPKTVEAAAGDRRQVERGRAGSAYAVGAQRERLVEVDVGILVALLAGESGGQQAFGKFCRQRNMDALAIEKRSASLLGGKHLVATGIVKHAGDQFAAVLKSQRDAKDRKAVGEVGGAVER